MSNIKTIPAYLYQRTGGDYEFLFDSPDMASHGYILIGSGTAQITLLPRADVVAAELESLNSAKQKIMAETSSKLAAIDEKIQSLLSITHEVQQ